MDWRDLQEVDPQAPLECGGEAEGGVKVRVGGRGLKVQGLSPSSFWVARLSPLDDGSPSRFDSQPHRGLPGDHQPRPHG